MKDLDFIPECYVDTNLIETLMKADVNHQYSCSKVTHVMEHAKADSFAVGIIDDDKRKPTYVASFIPIATKGHFKLLKHKDKHHYLIIISPAVDKFILDCALASKIDVKDFGLPHTLNDLKVQTKKTTSNKDYRFKSLFNALQDNDEMACLSNVLSYLQANRYNCSEDALKKLFV